MWTIPNILTAGRIAASPVVALMVLEGATGPAFALFVVAALTDFLDGWLARALDQRSALGAMLDPIADKAMVILVLAALLGDAGWAIALPAMAIILREVLVSGLREYLGDVKLAVTRLAKWKTAAQLVAVGALLMPVEAAQAAGVVLLWVAAGLTIVTGMDYFRRARPHLAAREG
ncbi:MAG: CDP-diacylglycerol--glycerol-3-phosphate 3-phosphatidyltransferase [Pseudomonadota bacterium]